MSPTVLLRAVFSLSLLLLAPSCKLLSSAANAPGQVASGLLGGDSKPSDRVPPKVMQAALMRFADTIASSVVEATSDFAARAGTAEARIQAKRWAIGQSTSAFTTASGPNANTALLDMVVLVTLGRMVHEDYWLPKVYGEADRPMLEAYVGLEEEAWALAGSLLEEQQVEDLRATLREWREQNPDFEHTAFLRLPTFREILATGAKEGKSRSTLGDLLSVDPLSGLEPAVREIEQARILAERAMFYAQRVPMLLSAQVELLGLELAQRPELQRTIADAERISQAAASLAETAARLPEAVRVEREAAIEQLSSELERQREGFVLDLVEVQEPAGKLMSDARVTLEAGAQMSTALQGAIGSLDAFLAGFREDEAAAAPSSAAPPPAQEPGRPFDVREYGEAASRVEAATRELSGLVGALDQSLPSLERALDEASERGGRVVDHAYARALELGALLIGAAALAVLLVRWISSRFLVARAPRPLA